MVYMVIAVECEFHNFHFRPGFIWGKTDVGQEFDLLPQSGIPCRLQQQGRCPESGKKAGLTGRVLQKRTRLFFYK